VKRPRLNANRPSAQPAATLDPMPTPARPRSTLLAILALWAIFYASFTLFTPPLLDDADSVHAEVAREMLLRHDPITLYANGIRYLEKAPLLYWSMALSMRPAQLLGYPGPRALAVAARIPLALSMLALALTTEAFARRAFHNPSQTTTPKNATAATRAGLYAALITLSSFGLFLYSHLLLPDAMVCLWLTLALYAFLLTEQEHSPEPPPNRAPHVPRFVNEIATTGDRVPHPSQSHRDGWDVRNLCYLFAGACALNVLTKGLIGIVFPIAIVVTYLLLTRGPRDTLTRIRQLHPISSLLVFLAIAAPWHILIAIANPTQGHPGSLTFTNHHWQVPLPTDGNIHGWLWFYFVNEQLLRYLNLRVPRDYDTVPLWLFWGLCLIWLMPWSAFAFKAVSYAARVAGNLWLAFTGTRLNKTLHRRHLRGLLAPPNPSLILTIWAASILFFFSLSTRQEYYVLPALPPIAILIAAWIAQDSIVGWQPVTSRAKQIRRANLRITAVLLALGTLFAIAATVFLLDTRTPAPNANLATLLQQNPADYTLSLGHFLDLNASALSLFRTPLALAALSLFLGPLASYVLRKQAKPHAATLALAAGAFGFLLAAHLGLQTFAPVLTSQQLAAAIAPQLAPRPGEPPALIVIHQEYEFASTLGFYLQRPGPNGPLSSQAIHILEGRSSNLWYGSFFPDAPKIFETPDSLAAKWSGPQRIFLWQSLTDPPNQLPQLPGPVYILVKSGGKEILSNQPNR
jgi:4-amino-4-deoxy-L-arabinose transferase-like glycosyltransferase